MAVTSPVREPFPRVPGAVNWDGQGMVGLGVMFPGAILLGYNMCLSLQGGPCGVLAAVQSCVLQKLLFTGDGGAGCAR